MIANRLYTCLNIGIVVCSFIESYIFPITIIKWMIVITKYGTLVLLFKQFKDEKSIAASQFQRTEYKYCLRVQTTHKNSVPRAKIENYVSHICVLIRKNEFNSEQVQVVFYNLFN